MAQKTHDAWSEEMSEMLAQTEDFDMVDEADLRRMLYAVRCQVRAWRAEFDKGAPERHKAARRRASLKRSQVAGEIPLWGEE